MLTGACNLCGLCCAPTPSTRCQHLAVEGEVGQPGATRCTAYDVRYDGMPIYEVDRRTGQKVSSGVCRKDSARETAVIVNFIGKGCSLTHGAKREALLHESPGAGQKPRRPRDR